MVPVATVHVGIVTYNSVSDVPRCLNALETQTYPRITITILDNASSDGVLRWLAEHNPQLTVIANPTNDGYGAGHNTILARCTFEPQDFYLTLNPDVALKPDYIDALVTAMSENGAGWATGKLLIHDDPTNDGRLYSAGHALCRDGYAFTIGHRLPDTGFDTAGEVFGAPGAAALYSRALIESIACDGHLFDPAMFMYGEDTDVDWRARRQGWRCWYEPRAVAHHRGSQAGGSLKTHALGNRFLSVIKNAWLVDLLVYNLPLMVMHSLARLLLTPHQGWSLLRHIIRHAPAMWRQRRPPVIRRADMLRWFAWSRSRRTGQPVGLRARLRAFGPRRGSGGL